MEGLPRVTWIRRNRFLLVLGLLLNFVPAIVPFLRIPALVLLQVPLQILAPMFLVWVSATNPRPRRRTGQLTVDAESIHVGGERVLPRSEIKGGWLRPRAGKKPVVQLARSTMKMAVELEVDDETSGRTVLEALGLAASQSVATLRVPAMKSRAGVWAFAIAVGVCVMAMPLLLILYRFPFALMLLPLIGLIAGAGVMSWPRQLRIGADGFTLGRFGREQYVPFSAVRGVKTAREHVIIQLHSGADLRIWCGHVRFAGADNPLRDVVAQRLREAISVHAEGDADAGALALGRGSRSTTDWILMLRRLGAGADGHHRSAPIRRERLWALLEDAKADTRDRAAAAVVLRDSLDAESRRRLRAVTDATAATKLRIALETVARSDADDASIAEALEEVEASAGDGFASKQA